MKSDTKIQQDVLEQLKWEPFLNAAAIDVAVTNGIVTLSGQVDCYARKLSAENAAKKIEGVKAIAEDIQIGVSPLHKKTDTEIAEAVLNTLQWNAAVREEYLKVSVEDGNVKLEGEVEWEFERNVAKTAIQNLAGVRSVVNLITVAPVISPEDIQHKINAAFHRSASIDSARVAAEVTGSTVVLRGKVRSLAEKEDAENATWNAPGVTNVDNRLMIVHVFEHAYVD